MIFIFLVLWSHVLQHSLWLNCLIYCFWNILGMQMCFLHLVCSCILWFSLSSSFCIKASFSRKLSWQYYKLPFSVLIHFPSVFFPHNIIHPLLTDHWTLTVMLYFCHCHVTCMISLPQLIIAVQIAVTAHNPIHSDTREHLALCLILLLVSTFRISIWWEQKFSSSY